jgi:hypothetical protein
MIIDDLLSGLDGARPTDTNLSKLPASMIVAPPQRFDDSGLLAYIGRS